MKKLQIDTGEKKINFKIPDGRHEITYNQWEKAYPFMLELENAKQMFDDGKYYDSSIKSIECICKIIASLSIGVDYKDLLKCNLDYIQNLFMQHFVFLSEHSEQRSFKISGQTFEIKSFDVETAGQFMDAMALVKEVEETTNEFIGYKIAAIYFPYGDYEQDLKIINDRSEWFKENARMDFFYALGFFLGNIWKKCNPPTRLLLQKEAAKLTNILSGSAIILYSLAWQKMVYSRTPQ